MMSVCIITGAGSGIGRAAAIGVSEKNLFSDIILVGRNEEQLRETSKYCNSRTHIMPLDIKNYVDIERFVSDTVDQIGAIDCLLNIAGHTDPQPLLNTSVDNLHETFSVNLFGPLILTRECVKYMKNTQSLSKVLFVASTAGSSPRPGWLSYSASKAALISAAATLSDELAEYNIKVYCISPGRCATDLRRKLAPFEDQTTIMQPQDVANIICSLIAPEEIFLDGQNLTVRKRMNLQ
jgi:3-oxoacyl-[acyl-carrier protein] reductase